jgi:hypothetical protein
VPRGTGPDLRLVHQLTCSATFKASVASPRDRLELVKPQMRLEMKKIRNSAISVRSAHGPWYSAGIPQEIR